jgi:hypothetical protein
LTFVENQLLALSKAEPAILVSDSQEDLISAVGMDSVTWLDLQNKELVGRAVGTQAVHETPVSGYGWRSEVQGCLLPAGDAACRT